MSPAVVEPYNTVLTTNSTLDNAQCVVLVDNEALYKICHKKLDIHNPTYKNLNMLLAQTASSITASLRFKGPLNIDFTDFHNNLVPFPKIHFPTMSYAPIADGKYDRKRSTFSVQELTSQCFSESNRLLNCDIDQGSYISCCLLYRGDVAPKDVNVAITQLKQKKTIRFVQWSPTGFKICISNRMPTVYGNDHVASGKSLLMICNSTAISHAWNIINTKFDLMLTKKAFLHWYLGEGMAADEFYSAQDTLLGLELEYHSMKD